MNSRQCVFHAHGGCSGPLWRCQTCLRSFCQTHYHTSQAGRNVECRACHEQRVDGQDWQRRWAIIQSRGDLICPGCQRAGEFRVACDKQSMTYFGYDSAIECRACGHADQVADFDLGWQLEGCFQFTVGVGDGVSTDRAGPGDQGH